MVIAIIVASILIVILAGKNYNDRNNFNDNLYKADQYFEAKEYSAAKEYYQLALRYKNDSNINTKIEVCDKLEQSLSNYERGNELFNGKDYPGAYETFSKVIPDDELRYKLAQEKMSQCINIYYNQEATQAEDLVSKGDYSGAIACINKILNIDPKNENALALKAKYQTDLQKKTDEEKRVAEALAKQNEIENARKLIRVISCYTNSPNSAGGVDLNIVWKNNSNKTIKYIFFDVIPYNSVGDAQYCEIRRTSQYRGKVTGPISPGETYGYNRVWECAWYNNTIIRVQLVGVDITYMDGTSVSINKSQVQYVKY
jgi:hypothetical protein